MLTSYSLSKNQFSQLFGCPPFTIFITTMRERLDSYDIHEDMRWAYERDLASSTKTRLIEVGFEEEEVVRFFDTPFYRTQDRTVDDTVSDDALKFLAATSSTLETREPIFTFLRESDDRSIKSALSRTLEEIQEKTKEDNELQPRFESLLQKFTEKSEHVSTSDYGLQLLLGAKVISNSDYSKVFEDNPELIFDYINGLESRYAYGYSEFYSVLYTLDRTQNTHILLEGVTPDVFLRFYKTSSKLISSTPEMARVSNRFVRSEGTWKDKIEIFKPVIKAYGMRFKKGPESDEALMDRIRVSENNLHPAVLMGLRATKGWEIEYDADAEPARLYRESNAIDVLNGFGFRKGGGGGGTDEASPGPCYDARTLIAIYQLYEDALIINPRKFKGSTCHYNQSGISKEQEVKIVRASYLTGASLHAYNDLTWESLPIMENGNHIEGKVFAVMDGEDFKWNFNAVSALVDAKKASNEKGNDLPGEQWRVRLAAAWEEWDKRMLSGMSYLGRENYLNKMDSGSARHGYENDTAWNREQLQKLYIDSTYTVLPDLEKVGQMNPNTPNSMGIEGVLVKGEDGDEVWYPNIAIFARKEMDRAVEKIEAVFDEIDRECANDILAIESEANSNERMKMIAAFNRKYNIPCEQPKSSIYRESAYKKVRAVYFPGGVNQESLN